MKNRKHRLFAPKRSSSTLKILDKRQFALRFFLEANHFGAKIRHFLYFQTSPSFSYSLQYQGGVSPSADGDQRTLSFGNLPPFEKGGSKLYYFYSPFIFYIFIFLVYSHIVSVQLSSPAELSISRS